MSDNLFDKIEKKTSVGKDTILSLANKLQQHIKRIIYHN